MCSRQCHQGRHSSLSFLVLLLFEPFCRLAAVPVCQSPRHACPAEAENQEKGQHKALLLPGVSHTSCSRGALLLMDTDPLQKQNKKALLPKRLQLESQDKGTAESTEAIKAGFVLSALSNSQEVGRAELFQEQNLAAVLHSCLKTLVLKSWSVLFPGQAFVAMLKKHCKSPTCCFTLLLTEMLSPVHTSCWHTETAGNMAGDLILLMAGSCLSSFHLPAM